LRIFRIIVAVPLSLAALCLASEAAPAVKFIGSEPERPIQNEIRIAAQEDDYGRLDEILFDHGYFDHQFNTEGDTVFIKTGPVFVLGDIDLNLITSDGVSSHKVISDWNHTAATRRNINRAGKALLEPFQEKGHYFASLNIERVSLEGTIVLLTMKLVTGPEVTIRRVRFKGLKRSRPEFVMKLSGLKESERFVPERYREAIRRIEAGDFLRNDSLPKITPNQDYDGVELLFYLTELRSNRLELGGGYLPSQGDKEGEWVGLIRFQSKNLFGSGRRINLLLDRKDGASSRIDFSFGQPFFVPDHLEANIHFSQVDYDSSYYSFSIDGGVSLVTRGNTRLGAGLIWTRTEPQRQSQPPSRTIAGTIEYEARKLDYEANPAGGRMLKLVLSYIRRSSWPDTLATSVIDNESMFEIGLDNYQPLRSGLIFRLNLEAKVRITSRDLIDYSEQFRMGGWGSLRGYRQDQFAGRRTLLGQGELRLRPSRNFAFYLFSDWGYIYRRLEIRPEVVESEEISRFGSGFGLFVGGPTARLTIETGWGKDDSFDQGKIHFSLVTLF